MIKRPSSETEKGVKNSFTAFIIVNTIITFFTMCLFLYLIYLKTGNIFNYWYLIGLLIAINIVCSISTFAIFRKLLINFAIFEEGLSRVAKGNYNVKIDKSNMQMFNTMADNFNKMTTELNNSTKLSDDFTKNFSHEFKTPISSIKGFAEVLLEEDLSKEEQKQYLKIIKDESNRLSNLSEKVLFLSKLNSNSVIKDKKEYQLDEQIKNTVILMQKSWEEKQLKLNINLEYIVYYNNPEIVNEIWFNLIANAIKYSTDGGKIDISLKKQEEKIIFEISDTGIGIEEEKLPYIFNEYYQGDPSHHTKGVGLGLSIVKKIVMLSGGTIDVNSEYGKGTTFIVML